MFGRRAISLRHVRFLSIHEHQAMELLQQYSIPVPAFAVAKSGREAEKICKSLGTNVVVKAQVLAGGRGKGHFTDAPAGFGGGVQIAKSCQDVASIADAMIAAMVDRKNPGLQLVGSRRGGMDIEVVAKESPTDIVTVGGLNFSDGHLDSAIASFVRNIHVPSKLQDDFKSIANAMLKLMAEKDATLVEINPIVVTKENKVVCLDAKLSFDDNAEYRQSELFNLRDTSQEDLREIEASKHNLNYIGLDGNIGCLVNGAGLAMATMDMIKLHCGEPANFLDVGGSADKQQVEAAIDILCKDSKVRAIWVNIFGGIMKCDIVAQGVVQAIQKRKKAGLECVPIVVRLLGTNADMACDIMRKSNLGIIPCNDFDSAARLSVSIANLCEVAKVSNVGILITPSSTN